MLTRRHFLKNNDISNLYEPSMKSTYTVYIETSKYIETSRAKYSNITSKEDCQKNKLKNKHCSKFPLKTPKLHTDIFLVSLLSTLNIVWLHHLFKT